ncbi:MAG TPA: NAD(P)H-dependent oxidoreductase [Cytophagaceae bacterium]|jgi:glutathione-regulated potassium-efflux system ancillary protein KefG|nr:NAD(P)H-dependent oxidoreductase [Cytophagaceae bacterium]
MNKILVLFAHPKYEKSRANNALVKNIPKNPFITFHDLYEKYPDFNIDIEHEQKLLAEHQIIVWHHPFYWYSAPALLKQWIDIVLDFGWAYGPGGDALKGKLIFNTITSGGPREVYATEGYNRYTVNELLAPFNQTARLCKMTYLPPFALQGTHRLSMEDIEQKAKAYGTVLHKMIYEEFSIEGIQQYSFLDEWIEEVNSRT